MGEPKSGAVSNKVLVWVAGVLGTVLSGLAVAAAVGGYSAVQQATTELRVLNANMANVVGQITELKTDMNNVKTDFRSATVDRWTKTDHSQYAAEVNAGLASFKSEILERVNRLTEQVYDLNRANMVRDGKQ